MEQTKKP
jgi:hypothetical protein